MEPSPDGFKMKITATIHGSHPLCFSQPKEAVGVYVTYVPVNPVLLLRCCRGVFCNHEARHEHEDVLPCPRYDVKHGGATAFDYISAKLLHCFDQTSEINVTLGGRSLQPVTYCPANFSYSQRTIELQADLKI